MSMLTEAAARLIAQAACTAIGTDLFILEIPQSPDLMTALFQYGGDPPELHHDGAGDDRPSLQVRTRAAPGDITNGEARAKAAYIALHGFSNTSVSGTQWKLVRALGSPVFLGNDEQGRPEWSQNFAVTKDVS